MDRYLHKWTDQNLQKARQIFEFFLCSFLLVQNINMFLQLIPNKVSWIVLSRELLHILPHIGQQGMRDCVSLPTLFHICWKDLQLCECTNTEQNDLQYTKQLSNYDNK
jgi:hypothetical protein